MKKKVIAAVISAVMLLSAAGGIFFALDTADTNETTNETQVIFNPKTELMKANAGDGTTDFSSSAFKAQFKYYSSQYVNAANYSIANNIHRIGGVSSGSPSNWYRYCAYDFNEYSDVVVSKLV
ncbi:MAG: hypothetical protein ACI4QV_00330, partial [Acutalibacteraceae bacterium]